MSGPLSDDEARRDFLHKALADAGQWARFADPKALAALAVLGLALSNLLGVARPLLDARETDTIWGWVATGGFWAAIVCAALSVFNVVRALFPRVEPAAPSPSPVYFFQHVAQFDSPTDYESAVRGLSRRELESEIASQVWEVSRVAATKHQYANAALQWVLGFLVCWAVARLALPLSA